jgi:hypothetical protein
MAVSGDLGTLVEIPALGSTLEETPLLSVQIAKPIP